MTMAERGDNSGALFRNERKEKPNQPDHTGNATIDGVEYRVSAWIKESGGKRFFSLSFTPKEERRSSSASGSGLEDDEIPF